MRKVVLAGVLFVVAVGCGGGKSADRNASPTDSGAPAGSTSAVQLTADPCTLITPAAAANALGLAQVQGSNATQATVCVFTDDGKANAGILTVRAEDPGFCKLLLTALSKNLFGGDQRRLDDVGEGGMLVHNGGSVQFVVHHACVSVEGSRGAEPLSDDTVLSLARSAADAAAKAS